MSDVIQRHVNESARAAKAAHAHMMRDGGISSLYVYFRPGQIEAFAEGAEPDSAVWTLAWPERVPTAMTAEQLVLYFAARTGRLPYLTEAT